MERSRDWVQFILDRPMAHDPGTTFDYNSGNPHLLLGDPLQGHGAHSRTGLCRRKLSNT